MKVALIGCGAISGNHLNALTELPSVEVVALCDIKPERARASADRFFPHAAIYTDYLEMLDTERPDAVHITTPHYLHAEMACAALSRDIHVFLEKPIAISEDEIRTLLDFERKSRGRIAVCFQNRFNAATLAVRELAREHGGVAAVRAMVTWERSAPYYTESGWRGAYKTEGGGVMINQAIHELDLAIGLCGVPVRVIGRHANHHLKGIIEVEDTCEIMVDFEGGARACFYATTAFPIDTPNFLEVYTGDKSRITMLGDFLYLNGEPITEADAFRHENASVSLGKTCWGNGHKKLIAMYYRALSEGEEMPVTLRSAADAVRVLLAAYRSDDTVVTLPAVDCN